MRIPKKGELKQIASLHSSEIDYKDFMKLYKDYTEELDSFLVNDTTLVSESPLRFRNNLLQKRLSVTKSKQLIIKLSKTKLNIIQTDKLQKFLNYHEEMLVNMNFWLENYVLTEKDLFLKKLQQ